MLSRFSHVWSPPGSSVHEDSPVFLSGESPWTKEPGKLQSMGSQSWTRLSDWTQNNLYVRIVWDSYYKAHKACRWSFWIVRSSSWFWASSKHTQQQSHCWGSGMPSGRGLDAVCVGFARKMRKERETTGTPVSPCLPFPFPLFFLPFPLCFHHQEWVTFLLLDLLMWLTYSLLHLLLGSRAIWKS